MRQALTINVTITPKLEIQANKQTVSRITDDNPPYNDPNGGNKILPMTTRKIPDQDIINENRAKVLGCLYSFRFTTKTMTKNIPTKKNTRAHRTGTLIKCPCTSLGDCAITSTERSLKEKETVRILFSVVRRCFISLSFKNYTLHTNSCKLQQYNFPP